MPLVNGTRVGLCFNMSLFYYEVKGDKKEGSKIAKKCFEECMKYLYDLEKPIPLLIQLLKENLFFVVTKGKKNNFKII